jgi:hypothetical protein
MPSDERGSKRKRVRSATAPRRSALFRGHPGAATADRGPRWPPCLERAPSAARRWTAGGVTRAIAQGLQSRRQPCPGGRVGNAARKRTEAHAGRAAPGGAVHGCRRVRRRAVSGLPVARGRSSRRSPAQTLCPTASPSSDRPVPRAPERTLARGPQPLESPGRQPVEENAVHRRRQ